MLDYKLIAEIGQAVEHTFYRLEQLGIDRKVYKLEFNENPGGIAGTCVYHPDGSVVLQFNCRIGAMPENRAAFLNHVPAHEVVHAVLPHQCGHGAAWKALMRALGKSDERCHNLNY